MARIYEFQGKKVLREVGVPIPMGRSVSNPTDVRKVAQEIGKPVAIGAQIWTIGRSKVGGIRFAQNPEEAERVAQELICLAV